ncbi:hypothetical protein MTX26_15310 [Bradyrhizobium sp. ISRA443]|uniref:hypothetical protein n=1 Tax=unclassified Bradyrhizobium TaxID=2631580 RepID=UPI00247907B6|nr:MULTISPECIES: hypothetical protein [unclassified Bradyrhizobium]WGS02099.1 hypothetical protein MTX23_15320 [Bradyrhizobium sp. ISRA436]WGS08984.1 hypothetical protein MTX18_15310 [Bradyrhizobium sp. ISRA437]WGS15873.1 hypothetical protein MTX26_15310 [Bradyrhizobium sp. ISRA443]
MRSCGDGRCCAGEPPAQARPRRFAAIACAASTGEGIQRLSTLPVARRALLMWGAHLATDANDPERIWCAGRCRRHAGSAQILITGLIENSARSYIYSSKSIGCIILHTEYKMFLSFRVGWNRLRSGQGRRMTFNGERSREEKPSR